MNRLMTTTTLTTVKKRSAPRFKNLCAHGPLTILSLKTLQGNSGPPVKERQVCLNRSSTPSQVALKP